MLKAINEEVAYRSLIEKKDCFLEQNQNSASETKSKKTIILDDSVMSCQNIKDIIVGLYNDNSRVIITNFALKELEDCQKIKENEVVYNHCSNKKKEHIEEAIFCLNFIDKHTEIFEKMIINEHIRVKTNWIIKFCTENKNSVILYTSNKIQVLLAEMYELKYEFIEQGKIFFDGKKEKLYCAKLYEEELRFVKKQLEVSNRKVCVYSDGKRMPEETHVLNKGDDVLIAISELNYISFTHYKIISPKLSRNCKNIFSCKIGYDEEPEFNNNIYKEFFDEFKEDLKLGKKEYFSYKNLEKLQLGISSKLNRVVLDYSLLWADTYTFKTIIYKFINEGIKIILTYDFINELSKNRKRTSEGKLNINSRYMVRFIVDNLEKFEIVLLKDEELNRHESVIKYCIDNKDNCFLCTKIEKTAIKLRKNGAQVAFLTTNNDFKKNQINTLYNTVKTGKNLRIKAESFEDSDTLIAIFSEGKRCNENTRKLKIGDEIFIAQKNNDFIKFNHYRVISLEKKYNCENLFNYCIFKNERSVLPNDIYNDFISELKTKILIEKNKQS